MRNIILIIQFPNIITTKRLEHSERKCGQWVANKELKKGITAFFEYHGMKDMFTIEERGGEINVCL